MKDWLIIEAKFAGNCIQCGTRVDEGYTVQWKKGTGLMCYPECPKKPNNDDSTALVIIDEE